ncbi:uncharacterized protein [Atheta coriaria]
MKSRAQPALETEGAFKFVQSLCKKLKEIPVLPSSSTPTSKIPTKKVPESKGKTIPAKPVKNKCLSPKTTKKLTPKSPKKSEDKPQVATKQTETNQPKLVVKIARHEQIVEPYEENVLKWLSNSQNMFQRKTQTQQKVEKDAKHDKIPKHLKSVSQRAVQRRTLPAREAVNQNYQRNCRSLESLSDKETNSGKLAEHALDSPVDVNEMEESKIEDIDSLPMVTKAEICREIEEQCLEAINQNVTRKSAGKKRKKPEEKSPIEAADKSRRSDWTRINKLASKIDRVDGIPKKLKISSAQIEKENHDTQFSTTTASQYGRMANEAEAGGSGMKSNAKKLKMEKFQKEMEVCKRPKVATSIAGESVDTNSTIIIDFNPNYKVGILNTANTDEKGSPVKNVEIEADDEDDIFMLATQPIIHNTNDIIPQTPSPLSAHSVFNKCDEFLRQYNDLKASFSTFLTNETDNMNYHKVSLIQQLLQSFEPKCSKISAILTCKDESLERFLETLPNQSTQTDDTTVKTYSAHVQTLQTLSASKMVQTSPPARTIPRKYVEYGVQTSPPKSGNNSSVRTIPPIAEDSEMKNTLDCLDFDTQAAIKQAEINKGETFTNMYTEQMPLTAFINGIQMRSPGISAVNSELGTENEPPQSNVREVDKTQNIDKKSRRKLYSSPGGGTSSSLSDHIGITNKRVKPLTISDSEDEEPLPVVNQYIREDISVCFDSESQKAAEHDEMNSPNVDKYLDDVWNRLQDQLESSKKNDNCQPKAIQTAIKTNTQDLIAKCEQMISNPVNRHVSSLPRVKQKATSQKAIPSSADLLTDSIFQDNDDELFENYATPSPCTSSRDKPKSTLHNLHSELIYNDSNSSISTNILDENPMQVTAIRVLQDVQIRPNKIAEKSVVHVESDEELIFSTPETTPTKFRKPEVPCEEVVLAPPPDFQDDAADFVRSITSQHPIWNTTQNTLNLSPIRASGSLQSKITPKRSTLSGHTKRVTSTPHSKLTPVTPTIKSNTNQLPITKFLRKGAVDKVPSMVEEDFFIPSMNKKSIAVVACTRLNKTQMIAINALAKRGLARYSSAFDSSVTHMVVATNDANQARDHTIKYVRAVAAGIWVVNSNWVQDSLIHNKLVPEEFYEVYDVTGQDGPKQSRLFRATRPLFEGFKMFVAPPFELITSIEVEEIVKSLGGVTVPTAESLLPKEDYTCLIIAETAQTQDDEQYYKYQDWTDKLHVATVDFEWLTRSIGAYKLNSLRRFALCTDESLCELGYPEHLLEKVACSFTQP